MKHTYMARKTCACSVALVVAVLVCGYSALRASIITDGSFENATYTTEGEPVSGESSLGDGAGGWIATGNATMDYIFVDESMVGLGVPQAGSKFVNLAGETANSGISQTIAKTSGAYYVLPYYAADNTTKDTLKVQFGGNTVFMGNSQNTGITSVGQYENMSYTVQATSSSTALIFNSYSAGGNGVNLNPNIPPTPEPGTWMSGALLVGVAGFTTCRSLWRKRSSNRAEFQ
jgi:uncharacterized protein DUF642